MAALPYMQLYVADYLADTMHLTTEEHGAYLLLIFNYWQTGKPIPKARLSRIARLSSDRWLEVVDALSEFFEDDGEQWIHLRIERDIETVLTSPRGKKLPDGDSLSGFKGYVYFVTDPDSYLVKVGYSKNPWARLSELRRSHGVALSVVATIKTVDKSETTIHAALAEFREEGEWFRKSDCVNSLISAISEGKVTTVAEIRSYVESYGSAATTTTNTDTDTDTEQDQKPAATPKPKVKSSRFDPLTVKPANVTEKTWADWCQHRREIHKPLTAKSCEQQAKALEGHVSPDQVLVNSISNGWTGIFPEKTTNVHQLPSRHTGFSDRDYTAGLIQREDGSYAF
ncbi:DUF1376 domain-containing protein [Pseudomonas canadensis]|uniref:DUF1376 domain-containing protein n=1 Tax=Pseudomonas canadensis TaxID=915099 RepID=UPI0030D47A7B